VTPNLVVITGMSGAGRSLAAKALEDLGLFVVDNVPAEMLGSVVERAMRPDRGRDRVAAVVDARSGLDFAALSEELVAIRSGGIETRVLFLDADDGVLVRRFEETRRPHPVEGTTLEESIAREREALTPMRAQADLAIDTSTRTVHDLRAHVQTMLADLGGDNTLRIEVQSFGFKHGVPRVLDLLFDVRFLPNPHWDDDLRPLTGLDEPVIRHVLGTPDATNFLERVEDLLGFLLPRYRGEGKAYLTIGLGCTGGRHRSVALAEALARWLEGRDGVSVTVTHRDLER
jgi:UPF0042 nucleotide-binding protein